MDDDEDAFSDDSGAYMEDMMMLQADRDEPGEPPDPGRSRPGGGSAGTGVDGGSRRGGARGEVSTAVLGRAGGASSGSSVSGAVSMEDGEEECDDEGGEEEFSEPGEDALVDDETTLAEVRKTLFFFLVIFVWITCNATPGGVWYPR